MTGPNGRGGESMRLWPNVFSPLSDAIGAPLPVRTRAGEFEIAGIGARERLGSGQSVEHSFMVNSMILW